MGLKAGGLRGSLRNLSTGVSAIPDSVIDSFEDGDVSEWTSNSGSNFAAVQTTGSGASPPDGSWCGESDATGGTNQNWERPIGSSISPTDLLVYCRVESWSGEITTIAFRDGTTSVHNVDIRDSGTTITVNGADTGVPIQNDQWFEVILRDIDWATDTVGAVEIDGSVTNTNIGFANSASSIDTILHFAQGGHRSYADKWAYTP